MTKTKPITYYASNTNYFLNGKKVTKYLIHADNTIYERYSSQGEFSVLEEIGKKLSEFYRQNKQEVRLHNCTIPKLESGQYRQLSSQERKIFLESLTGKKVSEITDSPHTQHISKSEQSIDSKL
jgi:hypothetical protein